MTDTTPLLKLLNVESAYGPIRAIRGVSLSVYPGQIATILGSNGAGKTTTLKTISGIIDPRKGSVEFKGENITAMDPSLIVQRGLAHVPEGREVFPLLSIKDNLLMGAFTRDDKAGIARSLDSVLERFPRLRERFSQQAGTLSGGEQQMMVIGRALMAKPRMLLLDEPSLGIAPKLVQDIARAIVAISRDEKVSVLLVEQNSRMALSISNRTYALSTGKVVLSGESKALMGDERIKAAYLGGEV